ncbi:hypothetical protein JL720_15795 [Aureococcus anophagefferens]|nr:hypothetical protein JL720_15795 [Aureococcus anophagefferens]
MNLYANLTFDVASAEGCVAALRPGGVVAAAALALVGLLRDVARLLRLRPSTFYDVALVVSVDGATTIEWRGAFETQGTGWAAFDEDARPRRQRGVSAYATVAGSPSWNVLTMAVQEDHLGFDDPYESRSASLAVDRGRPRPGQHKGDSTSLQRLDVVYDLFDLAKPVAGSATPFVTKNWDDVDMLPNGDLLVIDDGDDRPGCATANTSGYSRAIAYELSAAASPGPLAVQWPSALDVNFKTDDLYAVGGSAAALANGDYLVAFTSLDDTNKYDSRGTAFAFEVNVDGRSTVTTVAIPTPKADQDRQAAYRLVPWDSVGGETDVCPFLEAGSG